jgi:bidirectional [NiFe] hydrogenase diaphorase subunit
MALITTEIDGREIEVQRDRWALDVAKEMGISIPTLCHHPALEPYGACRLCVVEVSKGRWTWLTTSCDLPVREDMTIRTDTPAVFKARRIALELLIAQAPDAEYLRELASELGVDEPRFAARSEEGACILCGLCVRTCKKILGQPALGFAHRGLERTIGAPMEKPSKTCIGCRACEMICPTGHIKSTTDKSGSSPLYKIETYRTEAELEMTACSSCGGALAPTKYVEFVRSVLPEHLSADTICHKCRRAKTARDLTQASAIQSKPADG